MVWAAHLLKRHKRSAAMLICPCFFTTGVKGDDYFSVRRLRKKGAAIARGYQIRDIVAEVANTAECWHGTYLNRGSDRSPF